MDQDIAIVVNNVSKEYQLYDSHADRIKEVFHPFRKKYHHSFSALKDISFSVKKGEFFGIIGRNGCGKSTLLQLICGILCPTAGSVEVNGRIAALLELGAGFNPEFTGRENVYLNGELLGFSKKEMDGLFDEIVEFSEIGEFINQPVKTYSSGMYVRLAFAVQACVEPDVLIVDEALAVGDIFFRQKCYQRLENLRDNGCTVVLVSHAMNDVEQFCQRAILLDSGKELFLGSGSEAVKRYYLVEQEGRSADLSIVSTKKQPIQRDNKFIEQDDFFWPSSDAFLDISQVNQVTNGWAKCISVAVCDSRGNQRLSFQQGEEVSFFYEFLLLQDIEVPIAGITIKNDKGLIVHGKSTLEYMTDVPDFVSKNSILRFRQTIQLGVAEGEYSFTLGIACIPLKDYRSQNQMPYATLLSKVIRLCHLPSIGCFIVNCSALGVNDGKRHHGIADLSGSCFLQHTSDH